MKNYSDAVSVLNGRESRKIGNNTYLKRRNQFEIAVQLHNTDVVTYRSDHTCALNSGGYKTRTTLARINKYCAATILQRRREWFIWPGMIPFEDGMIINRDGTINSPHHEATQSFFDTAVSHARQ